MYKGALALTLVLGFVTAQPPLRTEAPPRIALIA